MNKISVIIPALNEENYIENCLSSLSDQNFEGEFETIVVDGHSKDKTIEIAKKYANRVLKCKKKNASSQRNLGSKYANGDILAFIDSDTVASPNWLENISHAFEDQNVVGVTGPIYPLEDMKILYKIMNKLQYFFIKINRPMFSGASCAFRKDAFEKNDGFNEDLETCEDHDISLNIRRFGKIKFINNMIVFTSNRRFNSNDKLHHQSIYYIKTTIDYFLKKPKKYIEAK